MSDNGSLQSVEAVISEVRSVFAEVTRYPLEILEPDSILEEDLGIDSVKLGEVFSVLRERYSLPERLDLEPQSFESIGKISSALHRFLADAVGTEPDPIAGANGNGHHPDDLGLAAQPIAAASEADLLAEVRSVFAEVTRYPLEILEPDSILEEDLGIDSVKLGEVFSVLRERYRLPDEIGIPEEKLRSIGGISQALTEFLARERPAVASPLTPAPVMRAVSSPANGDRQQLDPTLLSSFAAITPEQRPFSGKIALVSGSGRGLGKDIASYLAELGATVVVNSFHSREAGIETARQIEERGGEAVHVWGSVANPKQLDAVFDEVEERFGGVDFLITNASNGMLARLEEIKAEHWEKAFRTNVIGLHQSAMRALPLMRRRGGGKIVTLSSPASHGYVDYFGCMGAVKAAVESLTRSLAVELAKDNVQVNCVSPGPVYGELLRRWPESERLVPQWEANTPYERLCEARDVSHFIAYLLSDAVRLFTGSVLVMDGGISCQGW